MVKVPDGMNNGDPKALADRAQFLHDYGAIFVHWNAFEFALEITFMRLTKVKPTQASIVFGGLAFGSRSNIVQCLALEAGRADIADVITDVVNLARRNSLAHGAFASDPEKQTFGFLSRDVKRTFSVRLWEFTADEFHDHFLKLRDLLDKAFVIMDVTEDQIIKYGREAGIDK